MKKSLKAVCAMLAFGATVGMASCSCMGPRDNSVKLTIWVSEADKPFTMSVVEEFKAKHPEKNYNFVVDSQGVNDVATRILNDVENAADIFEFSNDQVSKLINGDALTRIAGERLNRVTEANSEESMDAAKATVNGEDGVYDKNPATDAYMLGDIVISMERAQSQAEEYGHTFQREVGYLTVHSMLHLLGHDHVAGGLEAVRMREKEETVMLSVGLPRGSSYVLDTDN